MVAPKVPLTRLITSNISILYMDAFSKLVDMFVRFPGVGARQAKRFVFFLLSQDTETIEEFKKLLTDLKRSMSQCEHCYRYFNAEYVPDADLCPICVGAATDKTIMMIVEKDVDIDNVKKTGIYAGRYFVFNGTIPLAQKRNMPKVRLEELVSEVSRAAQEEGLAEIIFGFTVNTEGEHTRDLILERLKDVITQYGLKTTTLGRGLSTGTELEYSDDDTLKNALKNRF
jgi:recombination protein RecR